MPIDARRSRIFSTVGLLLALALLGVLVWRTDFLIDDAFISFRYARNWAEHGVPAFHPDAQPPVEGYSNFLWVLLLRWGYELGWSLESVSRVLGILCGGATLVGLHGFLSRSLELRPLPVFLATLTLAASPPFAVWCTGGLETTLFAALAFAAYALLVRRGGAGRPLSGLLAGLAGLGVALTRVEGFLWVLVLAGCAWIANAKSPEGTARRKLRFALFFGVYLVGFTAFLLWRHGVYGEWVANTVHAKAGISWEVLLRGLKTSASYLLLLPQALVALALLPWIARGSRCGAALGAGGVFVAFLGYHTLVGGDWMAFFRFMAPATPILAVLLGLLFERLSRPLAVGCAAACLGSAVLPLFGGSIVPSGIREALYFREFPGGYRTEWQQYQRSVHNLETVFVPLGRALGQIAGEGDSLTFGAIGAVGWHSDMRLYDRNGLIDREVARSAGSSESMTAGHDKRVPRAWFLEHEPTMFHAVLVPGEVGPQGSESYQRAWQAALGQTIDRVFRQTGGKEDALRSACLPEAHRLRGEEGLPEGSLLMVLRATENEAAAQAFWKRVLGE